MQFQDKGFMWKLDNHVSMHLVSRRAGMCGDLMEAYVITGLKGPSSLHPCIRCIVDKKDLLDPSVAPARDVLETRRLIADSSNGSETSLAILNGKSFTSVVSLNPFFQLK